MMNITLPYYLVVSFASEAAPTLDKPTEFMKWAEWTAELITKIYVMDYEQVLEDLTNKCKEEQGYEDED